MNKISFVNFNNPKTNNNNTGDLFCSPSLYFNFSDHKIEDLCQYFPSSSDICIIGGGGIFLLESIRENSYAKYLICQKKIIWGAGNNVHDTDLYVNDKNLKSFDLVGLRDNKNYHDYEFVPCVSCMHKAFDETYKTEEDIVIYNHYDYDIPLNFKKMNNQGNDIYEKINFLASSNCIITNTYHGMYWGILLGKKVVIYKPFSNRFLYTPFKLEYCNSDNYIEKLNISSQYNLIEEYRKINISFYNKVINILQ